MKAVSYRFSAASAWTCNARIFATNTRAPAAGDVATRADAGAAANTLPAIRATTIRATGSGGTHRPLARRRKNTPLLSTAALASLMGAPTRLVRNRQYAVVDHPIEIANPDDPRIADYRCLTDVDLRMRFEPPRGLFIAEGELVIRRAVQAGHRVRSFLVSHRWLDSVQGLPPTDAPIYLATPQVLKAVIGFQFHRGGLASVHRPPIPEVATVLANARRVAVLEDVNTHTNVGAIFRCAAGLDIDAVLLTPSCADPLYRRAVRVSMGEVFTVPYARLEAWPQDSDLLREAGFRVFALTPEPGATALDELSISAADRIALVFGAEGAGLTSGALAATDQRVRIPMSRGVDSLNVAAAAAVAFYALRSAAGA